MQDKLNCAGPEWRDWAVWWGIRNGRRWLRTWSCCFSYHAVPGQEGCNSTRVLCTTAAPCLLDGSTASQLKTGIHIVLCVWDCSWWCRLWWQAGPNKTHCWPLKVPLSLQPSVCTDARARFTSWYRMGHAAGMGWQNQELPHTSDSPQKTPRLGCQQTCLQMWPAVTSVSCSASPEAIRKPASHSWAENHSICQGTELWSRRTWSLLLWGVSLGVYVTFIHETPLLSAAMMNNPFRCPPGRSCPQHMLQTAAEPRAALSLLFDAARYSRPAHCPMCLVKDKENRSFSILFKRLWSPTHRIE